MKAHISGAVSACILFQGLEECARRMTERDIFVRESVKESLEGRKVLCLLVKVNGWRIGATIEEHDQGTLVASLDHEEVLDEANAKEYLAAVVIPLVSEYVQSRHSDLSAVGRVSIAFRGTGERGRSGRR